MRPPDLSSLQRQFVERLKEDRYILAAVQVGSFSPEIMWRKETITLWIIEADGVSRRLRSDGEDERIFRTFVEDGINIHAEVIPRSRFRRMIEGNSRTALHCNFFALRELVYCNDDSIAKWFDQANALAVTDQEKERLAVTTWILHTHRHADRRLRLKEDLPLARQDLIWAAHCVAHLEVVCAGEVCEQESIYRAAEIRPELFEVIYDRVISGRVTKKVIATALQAIDEYLEEGAAANLKPLLHFLKRENRMVSLSELSEQFAHTQLYPWHLEAACEWLERKGHLQKVSAPFQITRRSRVEVEEPAYFLDPHDLQGMPNWD